MFQLTSSNNCILIVLKFLYNAAKCNGHKPRRKHKVNASNGLVVISDDSDFMETRDYGLNVSVCMLYLCWCHAALS